MLEPIYSLQLIPSLDGDYRAKADAAVGGGLYPASLGSGYADSFRRDKAPTQQEMLGHLVGTAYRCANLNANLLASTRLRLYLRTRTGEGRAKFEAAARRLGCAVTRRIPADRIKALSAGVGNRAGKSALLDAVESGDGEVTEVVSHPLLSLLRNPEGDDDRGGLSAYDHRWVTQVLQESIGRSYWLITERDKGGAPTRLLLLRAHLVREIPDITGKTYILRYEYGTNKLDPQDVIRFALPDPSNPHLSFLSPMRAAIEKIRLARGDDAFTGALLQNGGYPAGVWSPKGDSEGGGIGSPEARRMASSFRSAFAEARAGRIMVAESPGTLTTLAWKPTEIIGNDRHDQLVGEIADCFDVPRTKIFRDSSNRASGESGDLDHARDAGLARCSRYEETLNCKLVPLFDDTGRLFLAFDSPVPADKLFLLEKTKAAAETGVAKVDELRAALDMEPDADLGDCRFLPKGTILLHKDGTSEALGGPDPDDDTGSPPASPPGALTPPKPPKPAKPDKNVRRLAKSVLAISEQVKSLIEAKPIEVAAPPVSIRGMGKFAKAMLAMADQMKVLAENRTPPVQVAQAACPVEPVAEAEPDKPDLSDNAKSLILAAGYSEAEIAEKCVAAKHEHAEL